MNDIDYQTAYWDRAAPKKTFTHPLRIDRFRRWVPETGRVLDVGCGYGRTCQFLMAHGYDDVTGVDISSAMIRRGRGSYPGLDLRHLTDGTLPFQDGTVDACTLLAVLTCVPTNAGQRRIIGEVRRVLKPDGILYFSDYPLQVDARNRARYERFAREFQSFGVFRLPDGGVVRHHAMQWIHTLLADFAILSEEATSVLTMNGNWAAIFQIIAKNKEDE